MLHKILTLQRGNRQRWKVLTNHLVKVGLGSTTSASRLSDICSLKSLQKVHLNRSVLHGRLSVFLIDFSWALCRGWLMSKTRAHLFTTETCMCFPECFLYLFPWIWQNLLLSVEMFVQKTEGSWEKAIRVHNIFFLIYTPQRQDPFTIVFCIKSS